MNSRERIQATLNHTEPDRVPYDLAGTTVTAITKNAYLRAMQFRGLSTEIGDDEIDPIQQITTPCEENLQLLKSDTRRLGAKRISDYQNAKRVSGNRIEVTDFYGCDWRYETGKDIYFNLISSPIGNADSSLSGSLHLLPCPDWDSYITVLRKYLDEQIVGIENFCGIADRNTAGLTENSLRIRGYENWFMDTMIDPEGVDALFHRIVEDKLRYWDAVIDWAIDTGNEQKIQVISECDDLGSQATTILDPDILRQMVIPHFKTIFNHVKKRLPHVKTFMHSCGAIREILPDLIEAGLDILNPVQFTANGMDLKELKRDFGDVLTFWGGGVDTQTTLNNATPQQVADQVKQIIDILAPGGGFVFAPVHNIQDDVPPENFWAMWDTLQKYGKY
ncbi:MAG: uroporphyrinogen decarboxylase family protein [Prolixibacteraceae bacterium]|jgi:uroporphyrinogen decarboxylase|nr:uroporphyrinogen decarboxylase family protein [Prolixibacteraceae bacterium]